LGHYRQTVTDGNFAPTDPAGDPEAQTQFTNFNPSRGTWFFTASSQNTYTQWPLSGIGSRWILGTYDSQWVTASGHGARREYCFDAPTGFLNRTRTLGGDAADGASVAQSSSDLATEYVRDTYGNLKQEKYYG